MATSGVDRAVEPTPLVMREARIADAVAIASIAVAALPERWSEDVVRRSLGQPVSRARVVEAAGRLDGFILASRVLDETDIAAIAVRADTRMRGVGRALLSDFLATERGAGVVRVTLEVRFSNAAARALYERVGFAVAGERPRYYRNGETAVVYRIVL